MNPGSTESKRSTLTQVLHHMMPWLEDNMLKLRVYEYAGKVDITRQTASHVLANFHNKDNLLNVKYKGDGGKGHLYSAAPSPEFRMLNQLYWTHKLEQSGLVDYLKETNKQSGIFVVGNYAAGTASTHTPIDVAVTGGFQVVDVSTYEQELDRKISVSPRSDRFVLDQEYFYKL